MVVGSYSIGHIGCLSSADLCFTAVTSGTSVEICTARIIQACTASNSSMAVVKLTELPFPSATCASLRKHL